MTWFTDLMAARSSDQKRLACLIDPDDLPSGRAWGTFLDQLELSPVTDVFVGGSLLTRRGVGAVLGAIRERFRGPIVLFPGSPDQVVAGADAVLFLSLISGRNADYLIGRHVESGMRIRRLGMEVVPTGYLLVGDGPHTTASYVTQTAPIPAGKPGIAAATAVAGEMLGLRAMYLDAGSGAGHPVPVSAIEAVREHTAAPIIVGGGLNDAAKIRAAWAAGADVAVVGTAIERRPTDLAWLPNPERFSASSNPIR